MTGRDIAAGFPPIPRAVAERVAALTVKKATP